MADLQALSKPIIRSLKKLASGHVLSDQEIDQLGFDTLAKLVADDPVTCARYYVHRKLSFIKNILHKEQVLGEVVDHFWRDEFQQRCTPHTHMNLWTANSPVYGRDSDEDICTFVDKFITCSHCAVASNQLDYQVHKHKKYCGYNAKKGKKCRFDFPISPLPQTCILKPYVRQSAATLEDAAADIVSPTRLKELQEAYHKIHTAMIPFSHKDVVSKDATEILQPRTSLTFEEFLELMDMSLDDYIAAVRSSLKRTKVMLQRLPCEVYINSYNADVMDTWRANMDLQFVLDPYAAASYIISYMMKSQLGISTLMQKIVRQIKNGNETVRMLKIGSKLMDAEEIGSQEGIYYLLQLALVHCSRECIFVPTDLADERVFVVKPMEQLGVLEPNSEDIAMNSLPRRFAKRDPAVEHVCYADFACYYEQKRTRGETDGQRAYEPVEVPALDVAFRQRRG